MITLDYLKYFHEAAKQGGFDKAAKILYISSTSVVNAVNQLEKHYGVRLFVRKKAVGLTLTADGKKLLRVSSDIRERFDDMERIFLPDNQGLRGELVVGCQEGLTWSLLPRVICGLKNSHSNLTITTKTTWMERKFTPIENADVDILITFVLAEEKIPKSLEYVELCRPKASVMMRLGHPLYKEKKFSLKALSEYEQIMINDGDGYRFFYGMYTRLGLHPKVFMMSNISTGAQSMVGRTDAVSLRILRPVNDYSPLGDPIVCPQIEDQIATPRLIAICKKGTLSDFQTKYSVFFAELIKHFSSGVMRKHIYY